MIVKNLISMKLYREITDGIVQSLLSEDDKWNLVEHEDPKKDYYLHESGNMVYVYSGTLVTPKGVSVNLPRSMEEEISELTILKKRSARKFMAMREALDCARRAFVSLADSDS